MSLTVSESKMSKVASKREYLKGKCFEIVKFYTTMAVANGLIVYVWTSIVLRSTLIIIKTNVNMDVKMDEVFECGKSNE